MQVGMRCVCGKMGNNEDIRDEHRELRNDNRRGKYGEPGKDGRRAGCVERCGDDGILVFSHYHKYWADAEKRIKNPCFDSISGRILDLKEGKMGAVYYFYDVLDRIVPKGFSICVVPSSQAGKTDTGVVLLGKMLAANGRVDRVCFLERTRSIPKLATGGRRSREIHLDSIASRRDMSVRGEAVFLLDDVTTTGNSLLACRDILLAGGAREVKMMALGKALWMGRDIPEKDMSSNDISNRDIPNTDISDEAVKKERYITPERAAGTQAMRRSCDRTDFGY